MKDKKNNIFKENPATTFTILATCIFLFVIAWEGLDVYKALLCDLLG